MAQFSPWNSLTVMDLAADRARRLRPRSAQYGMRYRLRTLLILLALLPPILAVVAPPLAQQLLTEPQLVRALPGSQPQPILKLYAIQHDPDSTLQLMKQLYAGAPIRFSLDPKSKSLAVFGSPQLQAEVQGILNLLGPPIKRSVAADLEHTLQPPQAFNDGRSRGDVGGHGGGGRGGRGGRGGFGGFGPGGFDYGDGVFGGQRRFGGAGTGDSGGQPKSKEPEDRPYSPRVRPKNADQIL